MSEKSGIDELGDFLERHYEKFAIMGIFGSVTVFLATKWPGSSDSLAARVGTVAGLLIFSLSALWIAVKCFQLLRESAGDWPQVPQLGYAVILAGTLALGSAVLSASRIYTVSTQLLGEFVLGILFSLVYATVYPGDLDLPSQDEPPRYENITIFAIFGGAYLSIVVYGSRLRLLTRSAFELDFVLFAPFILIFGFLFFALRESLIGVGQIVEKEKFNLPQDVTSLWRIRTSLAVSVSSIGFLTLYLHRTARQAVGPNLGYYRVFGLPAREFTLLHWVVIATAFSVLILLDRHTAGSTRLIEQAGEATALSMVLLLVMEVTLIIPNGTHVIPF